ncbi:hypothetical protein JL722_13304 [Aureococcus anophagefferens]|nr:hypothetical protein JL722_13304 [Aureococcus anophagefferens]
MFAPIGVSTVKLADCRRVVLVERDPATDVLELRHYAIRASASGVSKTVKRVVEAKGKAPDLSKLRDISEYVRGLARPRTTTPTAPTPRRRTTPRSCSRASRGRSSVKHRESAIKLAELGPRLTMKLYKVQRGVCDGDVLYHAFAGDRATAGADLSKQPTSGASRRRRRRQPAATRTTTTTRRTTTTGGEEVDEDEDEDERTDGDADDEAPPRRRRPRRRNAAAAVAANKPVAAMGLCEQQIDAAAPGAPDASAPPQQQPFLPPGLAADWSLTPPAAGSGCGS